MRCTDGRSAGSLLLARPWSSPPPSSQILWPTTPATPDTPTTINASRKRTLPDEDHASADVEAQFADEDARCSERFTEA